MPRQQTVTRKADNSLTITTTDSRVIDDAEGLRLLRDAILQREKLIRTIAEGQAQLTLIIDTIAGLEALGIRIPPPIQDTGPVIDPGVPPG